VVCGGCMGGGSEVVEAGGEVEREVEEVAGAGVDLGVGVGRGQVAAEGDVAVGLAEFLRGGGEEE